jgi:hypothetical protein
VGAPDLDHHGAPGLGDASGLAERGDHVVGEEEGVEPGDDVERVVLVREELQVADPEVGLGHTRAGELEQGR